MTSDLKALLAAALTLFILWFVTGGLVAGWDVILVALQVVLIVIGLAALTFGVLSFWRWVFNRWGW